MREEKAVMEELIKKAEELLGKHFGIVKPDNDRILQMVQVVATMEVGKKLDELLTLARQETRPGEFTKKLSLVPKSEKQNVASIRPYAGNS
ncbi:hypothetical protein COV49_02795 [Candidatus Falkowbacteria bacterium CG11_big_fil_rev_8_21_14_0_20_39_10]|uniref:Uncharacterized protein n=1 Tax=Candidatus Falkowbacteria bacterium CG11_big_fil_rev_8_21_14_0_20_39_10 TaxID=1974570 RepID=A0A2M6K926_9BACT|nr:MAG: hypothetical protein COV49_02795 [Candidatus Falkowbacteria bacterium CG11_big_fil_rev_8_21_14_0_20_39_10]